MHRIFHFKKNVFDNRGGIISLRKSKYFFLSLKAYLPDYKPF